MENELDDQGMIDLIRMAGWEIDYDEQHDEVSLWTDKTRFVGIGYGSVKEAFEGFVRLRAQGFRNLHLTDANLTDAK